MRAARCHQQGAAAAAAAGLTESRYGVDGSASLARDGELAIPPRQLALLTHCRQKSRPAACDRRAAEQHEIQAGHPPRRRRPRLTDSVVTLSLLPLRIHSLRRQRALAK